MSVTAYKTLHQHGNICGHNDNIMTYYHHSDASYIYYYLLLIIVSLCHWVNDSLASEQPVPVLEQPAVRELVCRLSVNASGGVQLLQVRIVTTHCSVGHIQTRCCKKGIHSPASCMVYTFELPLINKIIKTWLFDAIMNKFLPATPSDCKSVTGVK